MNGKTFYEEWKQLFDQQRAEEAKVDIEKVKTLAGGDPALQPSEGLHEVSDCFVDPTLFSLLQEHLDEQVDNWTTSSRVRVVNGDRLIKRRPQAKDVAPNRLLEEQDEAHWQLRDHEDKEGSPTVYLNPLVPKKRRYFSQTHIPSILRPSSSTSASASSTPVSVSVPSTPQIESSTPCLVGNTDTQSGISSSTLSPPLSSSSSSSCSPSPSISQPIASSSSSVHPPLTELSAFDRHQALPSPPVRSTLREEDNISFSNAVLGYVDIEENPDQNMRSNEVQGKGKGIIDNNVDTDMVQRDNNNDNNNNSNNDNSAVTVTHPDIPETFISRKFMETAAKLKHSPLRTVKKQYWLHAIPRHYDPINFALPQHSRSPEKQQSKKLPEKSPDIDKVSKDSLGPTTRKRKVSDSKEYIQPSKRGRAAQSKAKSTAGKTTAKPAATSKAKDTAIPSPPETECVADDDVIFTIRIYEGNKPNKLLQEMHVLGSQYLTDMRDALYCVMDFTNHGNRLNRDPEGPIINTIRQKCSSSFFYLNNTFYVDQRREGQEDRALQIRDWVQQHLQPSKLPAHLAMDDVPLSELSFELNKPYLFCHQRDCQHIFTVRDIRLVQARDEKERAKYPLTTHLWRHARQKCAMCSVLPAVYITTNDYLSGFSPCAFCERCFQPFHYDKEGKPVCVFTVSAYLGT